MNGICSGQFWEILELSPQTAQYHSILTKVLLTEVQLFQVRLLLYGKCFEISLANLNLTVISFSISTKVGKRDEKCQSWILFSKKGGCLCLLPPAWTVSQWGFSLKGAIVMINWLVVEWVKRCFYVLLPKAIKYTSTFIFNVEEKAVDKIDFHFEGWGNCREETVDRIDLWDPQTGGLYLT